MAKAKSRFRWTTKKRAFVRLYTTPGPTLYNGAQSARHAGFSPHTAAQIATRLLRDPLVRKAIDKKMRKLSMSAEEAMHRLTEMGRGTIAPFLSTNENGDISIDLDNEDAQSNLHLVKKVKQSRKRLITGKGADKEETIEIRTELEIHDAKDALDKIARVRGLYQDKDKNGDPMQPLYKVYVGIDPDQV